jgi:hypothetical protein
MPQPSGGGFQPPFVRLTTTFIHIASLWLSQHNYGQGDGKVAKKRERENPERSADGHNVKKSTLD